MASFNPKRLREAISLLKKKFPLDIGKPGSLSKERQKQLQVDFAEIKSRFPALENCPDYLYFLEKISGLSYVTDEPNHIFDVHGFDDRISLHLIRGEGEMMVAPNMLGIGYFIDFHYPEGSRVASFAIEVSGDRKPEIYRSIKHDESEQGPYDFYCKTFVKFIEAAGERDLLGDRPRPLSLGSYP